MNQPVTEQRNPASDGIDLLPISEIIDRFIEEEKAVVAALRSQRAAIETVIRQVVESFKRGGRLFYVGAGTSGRLGVLDASECPPTFGTDPEMVQGIIAGGDEALRRSIEGAEDSRLDGAIEMRNRHVAEPDVVIGIATSGRTPYVLGALEESRRLGATTVLLSCSPPPDETKDYVNLFITPIVGPEIITGSTRLKAGTVTKLILNMISTISMIKLGKVYNNLMVDVQAWNMKLVDRAERIISEVAGVSREEAKRYLRDSGNNAKIAIVMAVRRIGRDEAEKLLEEADGFLRKVIEST